MINIAIIGHGFVGKAVEYGFSNSQTIIHIVDPKYNSTIDSLDFSILDAIFVCVPTPMGADKSIDASILLNVLEDINRCAEGTGCILTIIKSTITPNIAASLANYDNIKPIYNPEFLREATALADFTNPAFHVIGATSSADAESVINLYKHYSSCSYAESYITSLAEASLIKYTINSFLALKVAYFNQIYELAEACDVSYNIIANIVAKDPRIGSSHIKVPGFDGKRGFGGSCFPKDTTALLAFGEDRLVDLRILNQAVEYNNSIRAQYSVDSREQEQHIRYTND